MLYKIIHKGKIRQELAQKKTGAPHFQGKSGLFYIPLASMLSNSLLFYVSYLSFISSQPLTFPVPQLLSVPYSIFSAFRIPTGAETSVPMGRRPNSKFHCLPFAFNHYSRFDTKFLFSGSTESNKKTYPQRPLRLR